jgi:hypothetical protein
MSAKRKVFVSPVVTVSEQCSAGFELTEDQWKPIRSQSLVLDCDGAFVVKGNSMWPLVGDGQYVLYKEIDDPTQLKAGDIVLAKLSTGETLIKAWYPIERRDPKSEDGYPDEVFLASLYRGPDGYRKELYRPFRIDEFDKLRRVVGIWMG